MHDSDCRADGEVLKRASCARPTPGGRADRHPMSASRNGRRHKPQPELGLGPHSSGGARSSRALPVQSTRLDFSVWQFAQRHAKGVPGTWPST